MTAIQQFWIIGIPTILTSNQYPVSQRDDQRFVFNVGISGGVVRPGAVTDESSAKFTVGITAGARLSVAQFNTQADNTFTLSPAVTLTGGVVTNTAKFDTQADNDFSLRPSISLTSGTRAVVAVFNTQADESAGVRASVVITGGSRI